MPNRRKLYSATLDVNKEDVAMSKRSFAPSGATPGKPKGKRHVEESKCRKSLFGKEQVELLGKNPDWCKKEIVGLVHYIALFSEVNYGWPIHKHQLFWKKCSEYVAQYSNKPIRTGNACRQRVIKYLKRQYPTVESAEEALGIDYFNTDEKENIYKDIPSSCTPVPDEVINDLCGKAILLSKVQRVQLVAKLYSLILEKDYHEELKHFVPKDFISLSLSAMEYLHRNHKDNTVYHLCKCVGSMREDGSSARLDVNKMPFGLIAYNCKFFAIDDASNLQASEDYKQWMESMYCYFGNSWASLHCGPMWSYTVEKKEDIGEEKKEDIVSEAIGEEKKEDIVSEAIGEEKKEDIVSEALAIAMGTLSPPECLSDDRSITTITSSYSDPTDNSLSGDACTIQSQPSTLWTGLTASDQQDIRESQVSPTEVASMFNVVPPVNRSSWTPIGRKTMNAKVNVAGPSARTIRRHIEKSGFTNNTEIQVAALKKAKEASPKGRWWIKADATDMNMGLRESVKGRWTGDSDLADGKLQELKVECEDRLKSVQGIGLKERKTEDAILQDLHIQVGQLSVDKVFLQNRLKDAKEQYKEKKSQRTAPEQTLFALAWNVDEFEKLLDMNCELLQAITKIIEVRLLPNRHEQVNFQKELTALRSKMELYIKNVMSKKRECASHLLVFMISEEKRSSKPYALPVRVLPYSSITDGQLRNLRDELRNMMHTMNMLPIGFATDGEFNSLRTMGSKRPISVIQLMMNAKSLARSMSSRLIESYLQPIRGNDGNIKPQQIHSAVPSEDVEWLYNFMQDGASFEKAISILRRTQFPFFYDPHPWTPGKPETKNDCLKSLMAIYIYREMVTNYARNGIDFKKHLYVPEVCDRTGQAFHEREDHNHVLKRITCCMRAGLIPDIDMRVFVKCLHSPHSGLTYSALTGQHKQSVPDCERIFSRGVLEFMEMNKYDEEARFVRLVRNWHKASDGRGLNEDLRHQYNMEMLNYLLEDWMPWYWFDRDFSTMDVNRPIKGIKGFTREVNVALVANIESQELRRQESVTRGLPPEHPRASSTDDVEGFFAVLHQILGPVFDHKTFLDNYRKVEQEFVKRIDPNLPFYYWTGINERYVIGPLNPFNQTSDAQRLDKINISRRSDPGVFVANRAFLPQRGSLTVRAQFHADPERLPPQNWDL